MVTQKKCWNAVALERSGGRRGRRRKRASPGAQIFLLVDTQISNAAASDSLENLAPERQRPRILALSTRSLWAMAGDLKPESSGFSLGPLPVIRCSARDHAESARMIFLIGPRNSSGAHDFRAPLEWRGPMTVVFHEARDRWICGLLARNPCAIGIQPVHTRVDSCGLRGLPPTSLRRKATSALRPGKRRCSNAY